MSLDRTSWLTLSTRHFASDVAAVAQSRIATDRTHADAEAGGHRPVVVDQCLDLGFRAQASAAAGHSDGAAVDDPGLVPAAGLDAACGAALADDVAVVADLGDAAVVAAQRIGRAYRSLGPDADTLAADIAKADGGVVEDRDLGLLGGGESGFAVGSAAAHDVQRARIAQVHILSLRPHGVRGGDDVAVLFTETVLFRSAIDPSRRWRLNHETLGSLIVTSNRVVQDWSKYLATPAWPPPSSIASCAAPPCSSSRASAAALKKPLRASLSTWASAHDSAVLRGRV
jgi:hypothetical protein